MPAHRFGLSRDLGRLRLTWTGSHPRTENRVMLYMVELRYPVERRDEALRYVHRRGAIGYDGNVTLSAAWVATQDHIAYALVESSDPDEIAKACEPLARFGEVVYRPVTSVDQL